MKKSFPIRGLALAAVLACAGAAQAQSSVQLAGLVDMSVGSFKAPGDASATTRAENGSMTTSYWLMRGKEDLGSGLSAIFSLESFFRADTGASGRFTGDTLFSRSAYVGLDSATLGTLRLGRITTPLFVATVTFNAFGDSYGFSPTVRHVFTSGTVTGDSGWSDAVAYSTPSFGGLKVNVVGALGERVGGNNASASAVFERGAFAATAVFQNVKKDGATGAVADTRTWQAGLAYDFGFAKVFAQHTDVDNRTANLDYKLTAVSAAIPVTATGKVLVAYGLLNRVDDADRKTFSVGYDHFLSKRTDVYAVAMRDKDERATSEQTGRSFAVGIRHRF
ncbi:porin [Azohydromonas aeria]|uniref:porin n=1 Tax=Azohydromonas aeria TaxID=2590212 RepID=UPI001E5D48C3|nr:porin [Azohydromonas aeria]